VIALGFQLAGGRLIGPQDLFADVAFDDARRTASAVAGYLRQLGALSSQHLPAKEMEYTALPEAMKRLEGRFLPADAYGRWKPATAS
jgi:fructose 1,6-bisphosphate aldolase/phosphatase